jgi:hypothetical protein
MAKTRVASPATFSSRRVPTAFSAEATRDSALMMSRMPCSPKTMVFVRKERCGMLRSESMSASPVSAPASICLM